MLPYGKRSFHYWGVAILFTASVAYFAMASNLGKTPIAVEFTRRGSHLYEGAANAPYRSIWYARYIDWTITTPLLLLTLLLSTGLPSSQIFFTVFLDILMIETGLIGALTKSSYKFGFFTFGCVAMLYIFYILIGPARSAAFALGNDVGKAYTTSAWVLAVLWFTYPIIWGLADGGNVISTDSEMIAYGILDVLAKPGFILLHLFALKGIEYERFMLQSGHFSVGASGYDPESRVLTAHRNEPKIGDGQMTQRANGTHMNGTSTNVTNTNPTLAAPITDDQTSQSTAVHSHHA